jgi:hypothetical protein
VAGVPMLYVYLFLGWLGVIAVAGAVLRWTEGS